ncbi:hypothetical protein LCGC14_1392320 [marine sediment metagenome]|uniref:D-serine dehydratase-like domain-containing protein n=1 Tax=marine sediment metagenome TaxID=412755 RepID=A0A0F9JZQ7_9ZZZZ
MKCLLVFAVVTGLAPTAPAGDVSFSVAPQAVKAGEKIEIVPGHSDSTVFLHDTLCGVRDGRVEAVWPLLGRGKLQ